MVVRTDKGARYNVIKTEPFAKHFRLKHARKGKISVAPQNCSIDYSLVINRIS
jgi:hypothetical protein